MLTMVQMNVRIPLDFDKQEAERLKAREKERFQELQRAGKWRHLWRIAGLYSNISVFDVESHDELHAILSAAALSVHENIRNAPCAAPVCDRLVSRKVDPSHTIIQTRGSNGISLKIRAVNNLMKPGAAR